jgi:lysophospholipase L1-like esterase
LQPFPELPPADEMKLSVQKSITPNRNRPEFVELYNAYNSTADIVMLGDSITHLVNWNELMPERSVLNRGIAGDRTSDVLARLTAIRKAKAEYIFLMIGINDLHQNVDIETVRQNIVKIVDELIAFESTRRVFMQSTLPCNATINEACSPLLPLVADLDSFLAEFADSREKVEFLDLVDLLSDEKQMLSSAYTYDGLHLNSAAYEIWVKEINKVLEAEAE